MKYLVKMTPLEPYAFGTDQSFKYAGVKSMAKETYFVRSKRFPEQTTILGALRYLLLQSEGLLKTDFSYTMAEKKMMKELIGEKSFSFQNKEPSDFGWIKEISPVFLTDENGNLYVKNPFHNKSIEKGYRPMEMESKPLKTSAGEIFFPAGEEYKAKNGYASGYISLKNQKIISEDKMFQSVIFTGNRKSEQTKKGDDGFFKREVVCLKEGFFFGVYVEAEKLPKSGIIFMGQKKSAFRVTTEETQDEALDVQVEKTFTGGTPWFYALSDLVLEETPSYDTFCIIEQKRLQNLETVYDAENHTKKLRRSKRQYQLIKNGSVFYGHCPVQAENKNHHQIGYNYIVKIGGEQK